MDAEGSDIVGGGLFREERHWEGFKLSVYGSSISSQRNIRFPDLDGENQLDIIPDSFPAAWGVNRTRFFPLLRFCKQRYPPTFEAK